MAKQNALVKISGDLLKDERVSRWLKTLVKKYSVVILTGGGTQINRAFKKKGWKIEFGPLGRNTKSLKQKQLACNVLEDNQAILQDTADKKGINARFAIPVIEISDVRCHINGDLMILAAYNGFDKIFMVTRKDRAAKKEKWLKNFAVCCGVKKLKKIEVKCF